MAQPSQPSFFVKNCFQNRRAKKNSEALQIIMTKIV
jgi:hypothetical protein